MSSSRELNQPRDAQRDQSQKPWEQSTFERGLIKNAPHEDLPKGALAGLVNAHAYPTEVQPRLGGTFTQFPAPALEGRTGYVASKSGDLVTATTDAFESTDVGNYFVWPDGGGDRQQHDEILEYVSATQVRVRDSGDIASTSGCWVRAGMNLFEYHWSEKKIVYQFGQRVYVADRGSPAVITEMLCVSADQPTNAISQWAEMDQYGVIFNAAGIFLVDFSDNVLFKKNTPTPNVLVESNGDEYAAFEDSDRKTKRYDILYSMSRLDGVGMRTRMDTGVAIQQESGTTALNPTTSPPRDTGIVWTDQKIGGTVKTNGRLQCGVMAAAQQSPDYWVGVHNCTFQLTINNRTENFYIDMSPTGYNVSTMDEVASAIQEVMRQVWALATCEYYSGGYFVFTSGEQDGSTIGFGQNGTGGTSVADALMIRVGDGGSIDNANEYAAPLELGVFNVPANSFNPYIREWHWTHYTVYRTMNIAQNAMDPRVSELNSPFKFTYERDYRVAGAFYARRDETGRVTASVGTFEKADEGTPLEWEDGDIDTIYRYIDPQTVMVTYGLDNDYYDLAKEGACAIGGGRVFRASQSGTIVTRTHGSEFTADDERKTLTWADGTYSTIVDFLTADSVVVSDSTDRVVQGVTCDPVRRVITVQADDDELRARQGELHIGLLGHRFWSQMPLTNIGTIVPGFMITAMRDQSDIYYSQLGVSLKYLSGYYLPLRQRIDRVEGAITSIIKVPNKFVVFCQNSTWGGATNKPRVLTLPEFGETFSVLDIDIIDDKIGVTDVGSIEEVDFGLYEMRTTDQGWRQFDGFKYGPDMSVDPETGQDRVKKDFFDCYSVGESCYTDALGHILWMRRRV